MRPDIVCGCCRQWPCVRTAPLPVFRSLFAPASPEPRRRYPRNTASLAVTMTIPMTGGAS